MTNKLLQDSQGKQSLKRHAGIAILSIWLLLSIYLILRSADFSPNKIMVLNNLGYVGGGLIGLGVFEKLKKK